MGNNYCLHRGNYDTLTQRVTIVSPFGLPIPPLPTSTTPDVIAQREDYPNIKFWTRQDWNEVKQDASGIHCQGERGRSQAAQGANVAMWYIEDENSQMIDGHRASAMCKMACSIWAALENAGKAPAKWSQADIIISQSYRCKMWVHFPELQLCKNNWKADLITSDNYPSWCSHNTNKQTIKQENANSVDISSSSSPTTKWVHHGEGIKDCSTKKTHLESNPVTDGGAQQQETSALTNHPLKVCITCSYHLPANHAALICFR